MKKSFLVWLVFSLLGISNVVKAQFPTESTVENPVWYYIQVTGSDAERAGRVLTAEENDVVAGRPLIVSTDMDKVSSQLWLLARNGAGFSLMNKATGKEIGVVYDEVREISLAVQVDASPAVLFFNDIGDGKFQIQVSTVPEGGKVDEIFFHQANSGGNRDYSIMLVGDDYGYGLNSSFLFREFEDFHIDYDDGSGDISWYVITTALSEGAGKCMTLNLDNDPEFPLSVEDYVDGNQLQYWRIVREGQSGNVKIVNRAMQTVIVSNSTVQGAYNVTQVMPDDNDMSCTMNLEYIGDNQYVLGGVEDDGNTRFLCATIKGENPPVYDVDNLTNSAFAWSFKKVETTTSIDRSVTDKIKFVIRDGHLFVENGEAFELYSISGMRLPVESPLKPNELYIVKCKGQSFVIRL